MSFKACHISGRSNHSRCVIPVSNAAVSQDGSYSISGGVPSSKFFMGDIDRRTYEILAAALSKNTRDIYVRAVNAFMRFVKTRGWAIFGQQVLHK